MLKFTHLALLNVIYHTLFSCCLDGAGETRETKRAATRKSSREEEGRTRASEARKETVLPQEM